MLVMFAERIENIGSDVKVTFCGGTNRAANQDMVYRRID